MLTALALMKKTILNNRNTKNKKMRRLDKYA